MIFIKKTSNLFDKKDKKGDNRPDAAEEKIESEEEKQRAAILKIREALGQDVEAPIENLNTKTVSGAEPPAKAGVKAAANDDEIWVPKTEEEFKQQAAILEIRKLLGQDTTTPIKVSDIKKLEAEKSEVEKKEAEIEAMKLAQKPVTAEKPETAGAAAWEPKTEEERRQQAAIFKIRELLGEDANAPIGNQQAKARMPGSTQQGLPAKRGAKAVKKLNDEEEKSPQYLLIKKLLEEDTPSKPAEKKENFSKPPFSENTVSSWGSGSAFTVGAIINAEPVKHVENKETVRQRPTGFSPWGSGNCFSLEDIINAKPMNAGARPIVHEPVKENKKEVKASKENKSLEFSVAPKATIPNSPFFMVNFRDLTKD